MDRNQQSDQGAQQFAQWIDRASPQEVAQATKTLLKKIDGYPESSVGGTEFSETLAGDRAVERGIAKLQQFARVPEHSG